MKLARSILSSSGGKILLLGLLGWLLFQTWTVLAAPAKIDPSLDTTASRGLVDISVQLNFPPERFHILKLQEYGRLVGTSSDAVQLRRVPLADVNEIARLYWVKSIQPFER
jgi:hypothetical protein